MKNKPMYFLALGLKQIFAKYSPVNSKARQANLGANIVLVLNHQSKPLFSHVPTNCMLNRVSGFVEHLNFLLFTYKCSKAKFLINIRLTLPFLYPLYVNRGFWLGFQDLLSLLSRQNSSPDTRRGWLHLAAQLLMSINGHVHQQIIPMLWECGFIPATNLKVQ